MYAVQDNGVWLIVIVFGYIFGLFLIFVIIWFVWYGTSLRKRQTAPGALSSASSNHNFSQYDYSVQSSLNKNHGGTYFPGTIRTNPAFNNHDEPIGIPNQKSAILMNTISNSATSADEISNSSHTTSFVQNNSEHSICANGTYQHRISI